MTNANNDSPPAVDFDPRAIERAAKRAVQEALWRHRVLGETIVVAHGDRIVHLTGEEIPVTKPDP